MNRKYMRKLWGQQLNKIEAQNFNSIDYAVWDVLEKNAIPIQILVRLRLLYKRNGVKCPKNLFWRHANLFEDELIQ